MTSKDGKLLFFINLNSQKKTVSAPLVDHIFFTYLKRLKNFRICRITFSYHEMLSQSEIETDNTMRHVVSSNKDNSKGSSKSNWQFKHSIKQKMKTSQKSNW